MLLRANDLVVLDEHDAIDVLPARSETSALRRGAAQANRRRRRRPVRRPVCRPSSASVSVGAAAGSTPTTRVPVPAYQAATPPIRPPPPTATSTVAASGTCSASSRASVPLPEQRLDLVVGVDRHRVGLGRVPLACLERVGVAIADDHDVGAVGANPLDLDRRRHRRHEDLRGDAEALRGAGHGHAVVAARRRDHAGGRDLVASADWRTRRAP